MSWNKCPRGSLARAVSRVLALAALVSPSTFPEATTAQEVASVEDVFRDLNYRSVGPSRGGRVTAVAGHPSHPFTFYMGATGGGVWKTEDYGTTWYPISDGYFETGSIGSIRVAPSDPEIVYVGTGSDGIRSNVIVGRGVYRSDDAGQTWERVGLVEMGQIAAVEVHPTNPDIAYAAALGIRGPRARSVACTGRATVVGRGIRCSSPPTRWVPSTSS